MKEFLKCEFKTILNCFRVDAGEISDRNALEEILLKMFFFQWQWWNRPNELSKLLDYSLTVGYRVARFNLLAISKFRNSKSKV